MKRKERVYEIQVNGKWKLASKELFDSYPGKRMIDGVVYNGPVYYFGSSIVAKSGKPVINEDREFNERDWY